MSQTNQVKINRKTNLVLRLETLKAMSSYNQREMVNRYNNYSKYQVKKYIKEFKIKDFWRVMQSALLVHDRVLKAEDIIVGICDEFSQGLYVPDEQKIILCSNTLVRKLDFEDGIHRQLVKYYDHARSENYNLNNCRHLACSEVRAAGFSNKCNMAAVRLSKLKGKKSKREKLDADNYCLKTLASEYLSETPGCQDHSEEYVNKVFEQCSQDHSPLGDVLVSKTRSLTDIL
ncbi:unnamed protein product [Moneuplotes crassus]|uniref:Mitochondrial inner membrane protease ATP23 n=1 Tax=Euplotes crassus TaxID=5936 RepID=A0AAD1XTM0_EUPCR|nr:unnamed protein product [Moneuplotes crassus]